LEVLFRNNFSLSRDIAGLFQSCHSISSGLDPASNPSLFQSTLVAIIKVWKCAVLGSVIAHAFLQDVTDSDKAEVTRE
jgi:hypothetical protein